MSFFAELKRRNVVRVGIAYVIVGWLLAQVAEFAAENFGAPDWVLKMFVIFLILGLPLALFFAWAFELTPEGLKLEKHVDREESITPKTGRKLDFIIIAVMAVALIYMVADKFIGEPETTGITETTVPADKSIAVLPFVNMSDDKDYFADGLSEELLNLLAKIPDLRVIGRTSSFAFKGKNQDLRVIGDALDVSTVLEGSVRRSGNRLRITAQLINTDDGSHLWSDTYDREMAEIFQIQDDVARAIIGALELHLVASTNVQADRSTQNADAYSLYLESLAVFHEEENPLRAIEILDRALAIDPKFTKAVEQKVIHYWNAGGYMIDSPTAQKLVYETAKEALALDPSSVIGQTFMATADPFDWTWINEVRAIERAVNEMPENFLAWNAYCWDLTYLGYFREAVDCADRLIALEPLSGIGYERKGSALIALGKRAEAHMAWQKEIELGYLVGGDNKVIDHLVRGEDEEAITLIESLNRDYDFRVLGLELGIGRTFVESARDAETGGQYLRDSVTAIVENADDFAEALFPHLWYLAFGALDDYYDAISRINNVDTAWTNSDNLEFSGRVYKAAGYADHPRFESTAFDWGLLDLYEQRGAPDDCERVDGSWVCN